MNEIKPTYEDIIDAYQEKLNNLLNEVIYMQALSNRLIKEMQEMEQAFAKSIEEWGTEKENGEDNPQDFSPPGLAGQPPGDTL